MKKISIIAIASLMILSFALSSYAIPADDLVLAILQKTFLETVMMARLMEEQN